MRCLSKHCIQKAHKNLDKTDRSATLNHPTKLGFEIGSHKSNGGADFFMPISHKDILMTEATNLSGAAAEMRPSSDAVLRDAGQAGLITSDPQEILQGYSRAKDLEAKRNEVGMMERAHIAERRQAVATDLHAGRAARDHLNQEIMSLRKELAQKGGRDIALEQALTHRQMLMDGLSSEIDFIEGQITRQKTQTEHERLKALAPELQPDGALVSFEREAKSYLQEIGYAVDEIGENLDHRDLLVLRDALAWRRMQLGSKDLRTKTMPLKAVAGLSPRAGQAGKIGGAQLDAMRQKALHGGTRDKVAYIKAKLAQD